MRAATLRQLKAFSVIAQHHSFGRAAAELHVTRSAISMQIRELEGVMGLALFGRGGRTAELTPAGELLLPDVNRALSALKDAESKLSRLRSRETGVVSLGMVSNAEYFLPRVLARFRSTHADVELRVTVANRENLLRQLQSGDVDLAVMGTPPPEPRLRTTALAQQPLGIVASPAHRLASARAISVATVARHPFIAREPGSGTRGAMEQFFRTSPLTPPQVMELSGNESIKQAVMANMGLAFISLQTAALELQAGMMVNLDVVGLPLIRWWHVVDLGAKPLSAAAESVRDAIVAWSAQTIDGSDAAIGAPSPSARALAG